MEDLEQKLKNEAYVNRLKDSGVNVESLKKSLQEKSKDKTVTK